MIPLYVLPPNPGSSTDKVRSVNPGIKYFTLHHVRRNRTCSVAEEVSVVIAVFIQASECMTCATIWRRLERSRERQAREEGM